MCGYISRFWPMRCKWNCHVKETSQRSPLKGSFSFPLSFLLPALLNMMVGIPAIILDHEDKGYPMAQWRSDPEEASVPGDFVELSHWTAYHQAPFIYGRKIFYLKSLFFSSLCCSQ